MNVDVFAGVILFVVFGLPYVAGLLGWMTIEREASGTKRAKALALVASAGALVASLWIANFFLALAGFGFSPDKPPAYGVALILLLFIAVPFLGAQVIGGGMVRLLVTDFVQSTFPDTARPYLIAVIASCLVSILVGLAIWNLQPLWLSLLLSPIWTAARTAAADPIAYPWLIGGAGVMAWMLLMSVTASISRSESSNRLPRYDTQVRIYLTYFGLVFSIALAGLASYRLLALGLAINRWDATIMGIVIATPVIAAPMLFFLAPAVVRRTYKAVTDTQSEFIAHLLSSCRSVGIPAPVCMSSTMPFVSPQVFGTFRRAYVITPKNIDAIFGSIEQSAGPRAARALQLFVIRHEMAHLEYRDYRLFTWLLAYMRVIVRLWLPAHAVCVLAIIAGTATFGFSRFALVWYGLVLPVLAVGILYALTLTILRDRELLADRYALAGLEPQLRAALFEPTVPGTKGLGPLQVLLALFWAQPSGTLGLTSVEDGKRRGLGAVVRRIARRTFPQHPSSDMRVAALRSSFDTILEVQGGVENGVFAGAIIASLFACWSLAASSFGIVPSSAFAWAFDIATMLVASGLLGVLLMAPLKHADGVAWSFAKYNWLHLRKTMLAAACAWVLVSLMRMPALKPGQAEQIWGMLFVAGLVAYLSGLSTAVELMKHDRVSWPSDAQWQGPVLFLAACFIGVAVAYNLGLLLIPIIFVAVFVLPVPWKRT